MYLSRIDDKLISGSFQQLASQLTCRQFSLILWLHTCHCPLNHHLHRIKRATSPHCINCPGIIETVKPSNTSSLTAHTIPTKEPSWNSTSDAPPTTCPSSSQTKRPSKPHSILLATQNASTLYSVMYPTPNASRTNYTRQHDYSWLPTPSLRTTPDPTCTQKDCQP